MLTVTKILSLFVYPLSLGAVARQPSSGRSLHFFSRGRVVFSIDANGGGNDCGTP